MVNKLLLMKKRGLVPGAVAYWDCTQVVGQVLPDLSGNGNHATLGSTAGADSNDPTPTAQGLLFDGDDYLVAGTAACLDIGGRDHTLIAVASVSANLNQAIIGKCYFTGCHEWGLGTTGANTIRYQFRGDEGGYISSTSTATYSPDTPYLIVGTRAGDIIQLYVNGVAAGYPETLVSSPNTADIPFYIGRRHTDLQYTTIGTVVGGGVVPRAYSPDEIANLYVRMQAYFAPKGIDI